MWHMATYGKTVLPVHPRMQMVTILKVFDFTVLETLKLGYFTISFLLWSRFWNQVYMISFHGSREFSFCVTSIKSEEF